MHSESDLFDSVVPQIEIASLCPTFSEDKVLFSAPLVMKMSIKAVRDMTCFQQVYATALFNMGLACHLFLRCNFLPKQQHDHCLSLSQALYQQAFVMIADDSAPLLRLALLNNLMDMSYKRGDVEDMEIWGLLFLQVVQKKPLKDLEDYWEHFENVWEYFMNHSSAACAA